MAVVTLEHLSLSFGSAPLLDDAELRVEARERLCVIGRNGAGKSTLLRLLAGEQQPDAGSVWRAPGLRGARLDQDVPLSTDRTVFDVVADGLGALSDLLGRYHATVTRLADESSPALLDRLGRLHHELDEADGWHVEQRVELVLSRLALPPDTPVDTLSGGWRRRVLLARALVAQPDLLLLDEPTNHLDLRAIDWLETFLVEYPGTLVFVTHDRAFLQRVATRIVDIDRGRLTSWPGDYAAFRRRKDERLAHEAVELDKLDKRLTEEEAWLRQGIRARRTRNEGRVRALVALRQDRASRRDATGQVQLQIEHARSSGELVLEATDISKTYGDTSVVGRFSIRVMRGDRIGLVGPNGSGKTTLLRLLLGELAPDTGSVRHGTNVDVAYFDQLREQLDPDRSVFDTIGDGRDTIAVGGKPRHVHAFLRDFLFARDRAQSPVKSLSGGERNRLLLARLFTRPANFLVLDEPTNDLDLETLELLETQLVEWPGTLLLVTHDRALLDNVVTSTLVFEGDGKVEAYVGGYSDWQRQRAAAPPAAAPAAPPPPPPRRQPGARSSRKLSYREQRELEQLPSRIEELETEQGQLNETMASQTFYTRSREDIATTVERAESIETELVGLYARWDELDSRTT